MNNIPVRQIAEESKAFVSGRFNIRDVAAILAGKEMNHELHRHDFYFILALQKGEGRHDIDFKEYEVRNHSVFIIKPGQVHRLKLAAGCTGYIAEFDSGFYHPKDKLSGQHLIKVGNRDFYAVEEGRFSKLSKILAYMLDEFTAREEGYIEVIKANLDLFFFEFMRHSRNHEYMDKPEKAYAQARLEEFMEFLNKNIATQKQVSQYANLLNLSTYQLNAITKSTLGKPASALINDQILLEARRYLLATPNQIKEIADQLGYDDISYFIRFFKRHTGYSPDAFRKKFK